MVFFKFIHFLIPVIPLVLLTNCMQFRTNSKNINKRFEGKNVNIKIVCEDILGRKMRYVVTNENEVSWPLLVFIHGAPGSSDNYFQFLEDPELSSCARMISIDRPGYGYSGFGKSMTSIDEQASVINTIIAKYANEQPVILIGHSFGGPIAIKAAVKSPGVIKSVIMLAPAIDPENEKIFKIAYLGRTPPFRWLTPKSWRVASDEKLTHIKELTKMLPDWKKLNIPVIHIHGDKDKLVPYINLEFSRKMINASLLETISLKGEDHFLPWTQTSLIKSTIIQQIEKDKKSISRN